MSPQLKLMIFAIATLIACTHLWDLSNDGVRTMLPMPIQQRSAFSATRIMDDQETLTLEDLMYKYGSDKSRDDHGYTKLYQMLFSPIKQLVKNITEVGIMAGQSLQAWHRYFPNAEIHAFDRKWHDEKIKVNLEQMKPRLHTHILDILTNPTNMTDLGFLEESMDIIIEDGPHTVKSQERFLHQLFPLLKPGGIYVIEDVGFMQGGVKAFHDHPELLQNDTRQILEENDSIWVDTGFAQRSWSEWVRRSTEMWAKDRVQHNSYTVVIRKRETPLNQPIQINLRNVSMKYDKIVLEENAE